MGKKSWKGKQKYNSNRHKRKTALPAPGITDTLAKPAPLSPSPSPQQLRKTSLASTKTFGDYKEILSEVKRISILILIIIAAIIVCWLVLR
ncbi:MAG: hypothetical protein JW856_02860 [Dehalococcoidales bacterium]|nr:hypothetical protein [Dehalococcoidales bacterium]